MHDALKAIPDRILQLAIAALTQANTHAVYMDPGNEHWDQMSVLNAAHAGELFLKALIAREHPLLIFRDLFSLDDKRSDFLEIDHLLKSGRTHDFEKLPQVLWAVTGIRLPDMDSFDSLRRARNAVQHFCAPEDVNLSTTALKFIYRNIDPLIRDSFGIYAIEYHEDHSVSYDYVVQCLMGLNLKFSLPPDFYVTEIDLDAALRDCTSEYQEWFEAERAKL
jgi:hypothetical protein